MRYRKKPVIVDAVVWNGKFNKGIENFAWLITPQDRQKVCEQCGYLISEHGRIETLEGHHIVCPGDWLITGVKGERYPCKPDIFDQTYEKVETE